MNQQSQGMSSLSSPDPPTKRKRGRPRKDENLVHAECGTAMPGSESLKKNKQSMVTSHDVESEMVGQVVTGVIEGSFDAGYLLNVRVGDSDTQLRGVVFLQEKITPITPSNDIAPHIKMCKRKDIPIPAVNLKNQLYSSAHPSEQSNRQPVDVKIQTPTVPDQTQSSIPQSGIPGSLENKSFSVVIPPVDNFLKNGAGPSSGGNVMPQKFLEPGTDSQPESLENKSFSVMIPPVGNLPKNDAGPSLGGKVMPQKFLEPGTDSQPESLENKSFSVMIPLVNNLPKNDAVPSLGGKVVMIDNLSKNDAGPSLGGKMMPQKLLEPGADSQSVPAMEQSELNNIVEQDNVLGEVEADTIMDGPNGVEAIKASKPETEAEPIADIPGIEIVSKDPEIQTQAVGSEKSVLVHDEVKSLDLELNRTPLFAEPAAVAVISAAETVGKDPQIQPQAVDSAKSTLVHDDVKCLNLELNQTPVFSEPASVAVTPGIESVCKDSQIQPQDVGPEKNALVHDAVESLNIELNQTPVFSEPACVSSGLASKSVDSVMEEQAYSALNPSHMFGGETVPSESKLASEGPIPSEMVEPQISSSSGAIKNVDCDVEDIIPPTQS